MRPWPYHLDAHSIALSVRRRGRLRFHPDGGGVASLRRFHWTLRLLQSRGDYMGYRGDCIRMGRAIGFWVCGLGMGFDTLDDAMAAIDGARGDR